MEPDDAGPEGDQHGDREDEEDDRHHHEDLASGRDLDQLRAELRPQLRAELSQAAAGLTRTGLKSWDFGSLPREFYGELSLSGELLPVRGLTLAAAHAARAGHEIIVPLANVRDARVASPGRALGARHESDRRDARKRPRQGAVVPRYSVWQQHL